MEEMMSSSNANVEFFTERQEQYLAIAPAITGTLSVVCSATIIYMILSDRHKKLRSVYQRLVLGIAISDTIFSVSKLTSVLMVPVESDVWGAVGTTGTCTLQGGLKTLGLSTPLYNGAMSLFYLMSIRYKMREEKFASRLEPLTHLICIGFPALGAVLGFSFTAFNEVGMGVLGCFFAEHPLGCTADPSDVDESTPLCTRGANQAWIQFTFSFFPIAFLLLFIPVSQVLTYLSVRKHTRTRTKLSGGKGKGTEAVANRRRQVANQALWYVATFYLTWIPSGLLRILDLLEMDGQVVFPIAQVSQVFFPMQGVFVFCVYISPRYRFFKQHSVTDARGDVVERGAWSALAEAVTNKKSIADFRRSGRWRRSTLMNENMAKLAALEGAKLDDIHEESLTVSQIANETNPESPAASELGQDSSGGRMQHFLLLDGSVGATGRTAERSSISMYIDESGNRRQSAVVPIENGKRLQTSVYIDESGAFKSTIEEVENETDSSPDPTTITTG